MKEEMKGLYAAVVLSIAVIFVTNLFSRKTCGNAGSRTPKSRTYDGAANSQRNSCRRSEVQRRTGRGTRPPG